MRWPRAAVAAVLMGVALIASSCSTSPPEIAETFWQLDLVRNPQTGTAHERLSLFLHVTVSGGLSDLSSIYLMNDASELYWRLNPANWKSSDRNSELWVGSNRIETPTGAPLPRGRYRILLTDLSGQRVTDEIFVSSQRLEPKKAPFPSLSISDGRVRIRASLPQTSLWLYDDAGDLIGAYKGSSGSDLPFTALLGGRVPRFPGAKLYAYGYDQSCGCGLITGPYPVTLRR